MDKRIDPDLFARLMKLPSRTRNDFLEYFGQTSVASDDVARLIATAANEPMRPTPEREENG
jgi:hypothetical protein